MPTILIDGYKFRFYSSDRYEPPHVHIIQDDKVAKIWLDPVKVAYNRGYRSNILNHLSKLTEQNQERLLEAWNAYFNL